MAAMSLTFRQGPSAPRPRIDELEVKVHSLDDGVAQKQPTVLRTATTAASVADPDLTSRALGQARRMVYDGRYPPRHALAGFERYLCSRSSVNTTRQAAKP